jgi:hypothetical protein
MFSLFMLVLTSVADLLHQTSVTDAILCASLHKSPEHTYMPSHIQHTALHTKLKLSDSLLDPNISSICHKHYQLSEARLPSSRSVDNLCAVTFPIEQVKVNRASGDCRLFVRCQCRGKTLSSFHIFFHKDKIC